MKIQVKWAEIQKLTKLEEANYVHENSLRHLIINCFGYPAFRWILGLTGDFAKQGPTVGPTICYLRLEQA